MKGTSFALHVSAASAMAYGYNSLHSLKINEWISTQYGGHLQFLTIQGLVIAWATMTIGAVEDVFPSIPGVRAVKRGLLMLSTPVATIVSTIYWTLLLAFPHLILQAMPSESLEAVMIPLRIDVCLHLVPCLSLLADFFWFEPKFGRSAMLYTAPFLSLVCTVWYGWWVELCAKHNNTFPYPFLTLSPLDIRIRIYAGAGLVACASFYVLNALHK
ncbi:MFS general substrate transporter [Mycena indigotica]|uniref:MFS general substrate transporter n=1 Tax=Mycena indigotica TaxID=2126181 RepID=A0A8H6W0M4_9AGAR|nr:MFS general substrate transporter [Mycena indigotica]KAF7295029.1 MFS general substrate transporter [Mycena indigotica]